MGAAPPGGGRRVSNDPPTAGHWRPTQAPLAAAAGSSVVGVENSRQREGGGEGDVLARNRLRLVLHGGGGRATAGRRQVVKGDGVPAIMAATAAWATPLGGGLVCWACSPVGKHIRLVIHGGDGRLNASGAGQ